MVHTNDMPTEQNDSSRASEVSTPLRKEKKRVGFYTSSNSAGQINSSGAQDFFEQDESALSASVSPNLVPGKTPPGAPDAVELSIALTKILTAGRENGRVARDVSSSVTPDLTGPSNPGPKRPRPALRRNTSYNAPEERQKADIAESKASIRQLKSMTDARQRADRLAVSVGSYSSSSSRRNSGDFHARPFQHIIDESDDSETDLPTKSTGVCDEGPNLRQRVPRVEPDTSEDHTLAERLIRSHMKKGKKDLFIRRARGTASGTVTPVRKQAYAHDYVPRPAKYRGGILSSLLTLYHEDRPGASNSGHNTPSTPGTPHLSPRSSPPNSRPSSVFGSPRPRPSSGLFSYYKSRRSTSSSTLTELVKSSSMFAVPASTEISDHWAEKLRREQTSPSPSKKRDQIRITVHIAGIIARHRYLLKLCRALMLYGAPTHRLEEYMTMSSRVLEIEGHFLYLPGCMIISFDDSETHTTEVKLVRVLQGIDLGRLQDVHNIYKEVVHDKLGVEEATKRLDDVMTRDDKFRTWFRVFLYGIASVCVAPFAFQGRFIDLPIAFLLGCIVGVLQLVFAPSNELYAHVFEVSAAVITSFISRGFGSINNGQTFCFSTLAQSSIALILPGYMVLCSSLELQSYNIVAGSVRMVHAVIYTLFLGYGITIGTSLYGMMDSNAVSSATCSDPLHRGWFFLFVPGFTLSLCLINQSKWRQTPAMLLMSLAGFCVNSYCADYFQANTQISNMLGALTIGILANLYSRLGRHVENAWLDFVEWWDVRVRSRLTRSKRPSDTWSLPSMSDPESLATAVEPEKKPRKLGYSLAAAAMLPAIFVQVPSGLAASGSLLASITSADELTRNQTAGASIAITSFDGTAFTVLLKVIQVAIGISVGLFMSALIVYPLGKRRTRSLCVQLGQNLDIIVATIRRVLSIMTSRFVMYHPKQHNRLHYTYALIWTFSPLHEPRYASHSYNIGFQPTKGYNTIVMKIRSARISASIAKAILRRYGQSTKSRLRAILSFFRFFKLFLACFRAIDFIALRHDVWQLDEEEYVNSFRAAGDMLDQAAAQLVPMGDLGYSGSTFFTTPDGKFLIKSLPRRFEYDFFTKELLEPYVTHMHRQPHSLLVRITDLVHAPYASLGGILGTAPTHHIIMENLLFGRDADAAGDDESGGQGWETYDLKPNDYFFPERDIADGRLAPDSVLERLIDEFPDKIRVSPEHKKELMNLLESDTHLLASTNAVDYSLFLVRYPSPKSVSARSSPVPTVPSNAGIWRSGVDDVQGHWTYRVVVLDFFWAKHTLRARTMTGIVKLFNKVAHKGPMTITAEPWEYRGRFLRMVDEMVVETLA
ncbi:hypothetical protein BGZ63DRAFT_484685 [Mariannaea sp. PMI_226]|nr:hypothetical protein BGZ63DRAFT_484685 [Mariannaea sp. PMI_226]